MSKTSRAIAEENAMEPKENGTTTVNKVTDYIKRKIIYRELMPGDKIPTETELCQLLNVSRGSVREAMKLLEAINLIHIQRGSGTYISRPEAISFSESFMFKMLLNNVAIDDMLKFREQIEIAIVNLAVINATQEDIDALKENIAEFSNCVNRTPDDFAELHRIDMSFHEIFGASAKNKMMEEIYMLALTIFSPTIFDNYALGQVCGTDADLTLASHNTLIEALEKRSIHLGIHGVCQMLMIWKRWNEKHAEPVGE